MAPRSRRSVAAAAAAAAAATVTAEAPPSDDESAGNRSDAEVEGETAGQETDGGGAVVNDGSIALHFNEALLGRPGRPIPVGTLLSRLQKLSTELKSLDQDVSDEFKESCRTVAEQLGDSSVLAHKDKGVRAWAAQCIVDILALCAPDAPFTEKQLQGIFDMFTKTVFPALADPSNPYNLQHVYVLESLANVKSILLVTDMPNATKLMITLFTTFFDIYSGTSRAPKGAEPVSKHVEYTMLNALVTLVDEADSLPETVVDIIVSQFLRADPRLSGPKEQKAGKKTDKLDERQTTLIRQELPTPYLMSRDICNMVPEKMSREVSQYFSQVIIQASGVMSSDRRKGKGGQDSENAEDDDATLSEEDLLELGKAHRLVRELWRASPAVVQNTVPQIEAELSAENVELRVLAVETLGDLASGIGAAGPPPEPAMDPAAYPPFSFSRQLEPALPDLMTTPKASQPFAQTHPQAYQSFLGRRQDRSPAVRAAWATAVGRILATDGGGVGLSSGDEKRLVEDLGRMLNDSEERVRLAALEAVRAFSCGDAISKLGSNGGINVSGSLLNNVALHIKDRKPAVGSLAMTTLGRLWGVAHAEIGEGNEQAVKTIGNTPSWLFSSYYAGNSLLHELLDKVLFEELLPLSFPPIKTKNKEKANGSSQRNKDSQASESPELDLDVIRAERILLLVNGLDERARRIFFSMCARQAVFAKYMNIYLNTCEAFNGGVMQKNESEIKENLAKIIKTMAEFFSDRQRFSADLNKFAKMHDRRSYQLIRFCINPDSDYKTVRQAIRELKKRISESSNPSLNETLVPLLYRVSLIIYNRSHVPAILGFSKTNDKGLSAAAHEVLRDMSTQRPEVLETHIREMCQSLQEDVPSETKINNPGAIDNLKACAAFARKFPQKIPKDRKFVQALTSYTAFGTPPAVGKHAVSIIIAAAPKKDAAVKDITQRCLKGFKYGELGFLTRLASLSQLMLLAPEETQTSVKSIFDIALKDILGKRRNPVKNSAYAWSPEIDEECAAKMWALRIVVNRVRSHTDEESLASVAEPIYDVLLRLVANEGELSTQKDTPGEQRSQLRLLAAVSLLKLSRSHAHDLLLDPIGFDKLAEVAQDGLFEVRRAFILKLRKYLSRNSLPPRFYVIPFLLAYEPEKPLKTEMTTWLKHRTLLFASQATAVPVNGKTPAVKPKAPTTMEATIPRLLSLLAHYPDYDQAETGLQETAQYILFYLVCVATAENVSLIYHLTQRIKAHKDAVLNSASLPFSKTIQKAEASINFDIRLHTLSDLACALIRSFVEAQSWNIQSLPGRAKLPLSLYGDIRSHDEAIAVAETDFLPNELRETIDRLVQQALRKKARGEGRKRKSEAAGAGDQDGVKSAKRAKRSSTSRSRSERQSKGGKKRRGSQWDDDGDDDEPGGRRSAGNKRSSVSDKDRRKSGRASIAAQYTERDDDEDDEEMLDGVAEWEYETGERWKEQQSSSEDESAESGSRSGGEGDDNQDEAGDAESDQEAPPAPKSGRAGKAAAGRQRGGAVGKSSAASSKQKGNIQKSLPTRSGRATRSAAA